MPRRGSILKDNISEESEQANNTNLPERSIVQFQRLQGKELRSVSYGSDPEMNFIAIAGEGI
jgi:hypothetical protein